MQKTVLLTDDELSLLEPLEDALKYEGINVLKANTISKAITILKRNKIDLITIDLMIDPGEELSSKISEPLPGLFLCKTIYRDYANIDGICLSVISDLNIIREVESMGIKFIRKGETPLRTLLNIINSRLTGIAYSKDFG